MKNKTDVLRSIYLYSVSLIGLITFVFALISGSNSLIDILMKSSNTDFTYSSLYSSLFAFVGGLFVFLYHWAIIMREGRFGKKNRETTNTDDDFWGSLFFYIVSFIGLMIVLFSFIRIGSNIMKVNYANIEIPNNPVQKPSKPEITYTTDMRGIVQSITSMAIGLFVWLIPYSHIEKEYRKDESKEFTE